MDPRFDARAWPWFVASKRVGDPAPARAPAVVGAIGGFVAVGAIVLMLAWGFRLLMAAEGRIFDWPSSIYWTVVTMSTLGYGDIVFESNPGRLYSVLVVAVGALLLLGLLPLVIVRTIYVPMIRALRRSRVPRQLRSTVSNHVIITGEGTVRDALVSHFRATRRPYVVLVADVEQALTLHDSGTHVVVGNLDSPSTYRRIQAARAAMLFAGGPDTTNTNISFTMREVSRQTPIVTTASSAEACDVLRLAGSDHVLQLAELLGAQLAQQILAREPRTNIVTTFDRVAIAEISAAGTRLVGRRLGELAPDRESDIRLLGVWTRGRLDWAEPSHRLTEESFILLAGTPDGLRAYDRFLTRQIGEEDSSPSEEHVLILGGGRVGRALAGHLTAAGTRWTIVERSPTRVAEIPGDIVIGDAADHRTLQRAHLDRATTIVVTTHDDDTNIFLTLYCRKLRPDADLLGRVNADRNVLTMHRAGADIALSYPSAAVTAVRNVLRNRSRSLLAEGLVAFRAPVPKRHIGRTIGDLADEALEGCRVVAVAQHGAFLTPSPPHLVLERDDELLLLGTVRDEARLLQRYTHVRSGRRRERIDAERSDPTGPREPSPPP